MIVSNVNIGSGPGVGDGDSLYTAFDKVNHNFANVLSNVNNLSNSVTSVAGRTGNVVLTINDIVGYTAYVTQSNLNAANTAMKGYVDSQPFYSNTLVATYLQNGNIANISVAGNVTARYFLGNGALLTGIVAGGSSYSNVQVQSYLTTNGYTTEVNTAAISSNVLTLDFNLSTQIVTHSANISNVAIIHGPANLTTKSMTVILSQDATGGRTISGYYKTQDGLGLDIDTTALAVNIYTFLAVNNGSGTSLYAFSNGTNFI